jgi:hypothetical protein
MKNMIRRRLTTAIYLVLMTAAAGAQPMQEMIHACPATAAPLPPAFSGWTMKATLGSAAQASALKAATLPLGQGVLVALHPTRQVRYVTQPEKPGGSMAHGGMVALPIAATGRYQVSLSSGAWIDVLKDGTPQRSVAHAPGPKCSPIRKTVVFLLQPGSYVLQISANTDPAVTVMVTRVS